MKLITCLLGCFMFIGLNAQNGATISGRVIDESSKALPYATITIIYKFSGKMVSGDVTDIDGRFELKGIAPSEYTVAVSFIGYDEVREDILIGELNSSFYLGNIKLTASSENLDEVTVFAQQSIISAGMDKKTFSLSDNIAQSGGSVLDAMKTMPGITVDQEGKVILRGSDKVIILIDGKQSSLTGFGNQKGLDNIPAANIDHIEIINNPSAKYDAAGMAGIINIIYKKEKETGFNGDAGFAYGLGALTKRKSDLPTVLGSYSMNPKYIPSLNLNYRMPKVNLFLQSEGMFLNALPNNEFTTRYYNDNRVTASHVPENRTQRHIILNAGMDLIINDNNTLTVSAVFDREIHTDTAQVPYIDMLTGDRYRYITWHEEEITGYMNYTASFKHKFEQPGHEFDLHAQYTKGWEDETYYINDSSSIRNGRDVTSILATEHTTNLLLDYIKPLKRGRLEAGFKYQLRRLPVDYSIIRGDNSIIYPGLGEWSDWGENIYAGYLNYVHEWKTYDIEAGMRAERADVFYDIDPANIYYSENDAYNYFKIFPNIRISLKPHKNHRISIFYNQRIDRPGEPELRIFPKSDDHELLKIGNPYLRPQYTQAVELAYRWKWESGSAFLSGYFKKINNPFIRIYTTDTSNINYDVIVKIYANTGSATNKGLEFVFSQQIFEIWKLSGNVNYYINEIDAYEGSILFPYENTFSIEKSVDNTWDFKISNQLYLPHDLEIQLTAVYLAPKNIPQGMQMARSSIDFGVKKTVLKEKGEISLSASDIFNKYGIKQEISGDSFEAIYENYYETQVFRVGFKYKF